MRKLITAAEFTGIHRKGKEQIWKSDFPELETIKPTICALAPRPGRPPTAHPLLRHCLAESRSGDVSPPAVAVYFGGELWWP